MTIKSDKKIKYLKLRLRAQSLLLDEVVRTLRESDPQKVEALSEGIIEQAYHFDREGDRPLARELREVVGALE